MQSRARAHDDNSTALGLGLDVVRSEGHGLDDAVEIDVDRVVVWLLWIAILVHLEGQVVGTRTNSSVGKDIVNSAMLFLGSLEKLRQVGPLPDISLHMEGVFVSRGRCLDVAAHN